MRLRALGAAALLCAVLAACGASGSAAERHDSADTAFAQQMLVHHRGAVRMAQLADGRTTDAQVTELAQRIEAAQAPEIDRMTGWLQAWDEPVTAQGPSSTDGPGHDAMGMSSDDQMRQLEAATGPAFDTLFLQLMTTHHEGAIAMAVDEQSAGTNEAAIALARSMEESQSAEVAEMGDLLAGP